MIRRAIGHYNTLNENRSHGDRAVYQEFGRRLQARMMALGWNQTELARRATAYLPKPAKGQVQGLTVGRDLISNYIRGKYLPRPALLAALAKALKCKQGDLLPAEVVPSVVDEGPYFNTKRVDDRRSAIRLNRVVSNGTLAGIMALLAKEDQL